MADEGPTREPDGNVAARGERKRRAVLGDARVERALAAATPFDAEFQDFITRYAWGEVWSREGIDDRTRHLITLAVVAALGREEEFAMHVRATARTGVTSEELKEALFLVAIYAGLPAANGAFRLAKEVLAGAAGATDDAGQPTEGAGALADADEDRGKER